MPVMLSDEELRSLKMTENQIRLELAISLFSQERLSLGKAAEFVGLHQIEMQRILAERGIPQHYDAEEFKRDLETLDRLK